MAAMMKSEGVGFGGREDELESEDLQESGNCVALQACWITAGCGATFIDGGCLPSNGGRRWRWKLAAAAAVEAGDRERRKTRERTDNARRDAMEMRKRNDHLGGALVWWDFVMAEAWCMIMPLEHAEQRSGGRRWIVGGGRWPAAADPDLQIRIRDRFRKGDPSVFPPNQEIPGTRLSTGRPIGYREGRKLQNCRD